MQVNLNVALGSKVKLYKDSRDGPLRVVMDITQKSTTSEMDPSWPLATQDRDSSAWRASE